MAKRGFYMRKRFVLREELFGFTLFDRQKMRHKFIQNNNQEDLKLIEKVADDCEKWNSDLTNSPKDIIYSPIRIYFEFTAACNLRCRTCFNESGLPKPNELNTSEVKKTLKGLRKDKVFDIRFSGGETTQRKDWFEILKYAKKLGFSVSLNTNGVYSDQTTIINKLIKLDLEQITFSIDGNKKFHDYIRGEGNYEKTVSSIKKLHEKGAHLRINTLITKGSAKSLEDILSLAGKYVEEINFFVMRPIGRGAHLLNEVLSYKELCNFNEKIEKFKSKYPHVNILYGSKVTIANSIKAKTESKLGLKLGGPDGLTRFNLSPDGSIWPGGYTPFLRPDFYLGNIKTEGFSILNVWRNSEKLKQFREESFKIQNKCLTCPENGVRCPGAGIEMEFYREKSLNQKNPYCKF